MNQSSVLGLYSPKMAKTKNLSPVEKSVSPVKKLKKMVDISLYEYKRDRSPRSKSKKQDRNFSISKLKGNQRRAHNKIIEKLRASSVNPRRSL